LQLLLEQCRHCVNQPDALGRTALHTACGEGSAEVAAMLLSTPGVDVNAADQRLATPLHWAAVCNRGDVCTALLQAGARLMSRDAQGLSALHYATEKGFHDCASAMQRFGCGGATLLRPAVGEGGGVGRPPSASRR
jgi:ankyrin repeat protein